MSYRPPSGSVITYDGGTWTAPGKPPVKVQLSFDARLIAWLVNRAAHRVPTVYRIAEGTPPLTITLTPA